MNPEIDPRIETPEEWVNIGDANPQRYGGIFVKWEKDYWEVINTTHFAELHDDFSDDEYMFEVYYVEPDDIWINGNPYKGFTDFAIEKLNKYSNLPFDIVTNEADLPEEEQYHDYVDWYLNEHNEFIITRFISSFIGFHGTYDTHFESDYWGYLSNYGIEESDF